MRQKNKQAMNVFLENPFNKLDWFLFGLVGIICFFSFEHSDIIHTATGALGFLNGHFLDFYEYGDALIGGMNYLPSTFVFFAIWNIPLYFLGIISAPTMTVPLCAVMWFKLLPVLFYLATGFVLYRIGQRIGLKNATAKALMYLFYVAPIGFFSQFIFGQYDIFTVFFILLGFLSFLKQDRLKFIIFFAFAITFKYFALLFFLPLLLLWEKDVKKIICQLLIVLIPLGIEVICYYHSVVFRSSVLGFSATGSVLTPNIVVSQGLGISIVIIGWIFVCGWSYMKQPQTKIETVQWSIYFSNLVTFVVFGFSLWHPQWLLIAVPFWVMGTLINKKRTAFYWLDIVLYIVFLLFIVAWHECNVDQTMFSCGIFRDFYYASAVTMRQLFHYSDVNVLFSFFTGVLMVYTVFKHPKFCESDFSKIDITPDRNLVRNGFIFCALLFIIPASICFYGGLTTKHEVMNFQSAEQPVKVMDVKLTSGDEIGEVFVANNPYVTAISFRMKTFEKENQCDLIVTLQDWETKDVIATEHLDSSLVAEGIVVYYPFPETKIIQGKTYCLSFHTEGVTENDAMAFYRGWSNNNFDGFAVVNGKRQNYDLDLKIYGR